MPLSLKSSVNGGSNMPEFLEYFIYNISPSLAAGTGVVYSDTNLLLANNDYIFKRTIHVATSNVINVKIYNPDTGRYLFKNADDLRHISGTSLNGITAYGFVPFNWPVPYRAKANTYMTISLADNSGNPNTLYLAYHGDQVSPVAPLDMYDEPLDYSLEKKGMRKVMPIIYDSGSITTGAAVGAINQGVIQIDNDADFICTKITGISTNTGFISILDEQRRLAWQNQKTHIQTLLGNGQFPNILTTPRFVKKNTPLLITWENLAGGANTLNLFLHGYKRKR